MHDLCMSPDMWYLGMQGVGPEVLKQELMQHGLKCGGTLAERAARLFLLRDTPLDRLDRKHFAKPSTKK